jgi:hypothetical protein
MAMRGLLLASIVVLALGPADSAHGGWRTYGSANRTSRTYQGQRPGGQANWRTYGVANKISPNGVWWRGYGRMGYGWYSVYGDYVGSDYSWINYGYRNRSSGFNFNRTDNYGFIDPRAIGDRAR